MCFPSFQLLKFHSVTKSFGPKRVLEELTFTINRGDRFALIGENGCGKTTLARLAAGIDSPDQGQISRAENCTIGFLPQSVDAQCPDDVSLETYFLQSQGNLEKISQQLREIEEALADPEVNHDTEQLMTRWDELHSRFVSMGGYSASERAKEYLAALGLENICLSRTLSSLSGGEKRRAGLASLLIKNPDFLILDEPTNHLDREALHWLENYLRKYSGAILLISHDRKFLNQVANGIFELSSTNHNLHYYAGNYDDYLAEKQRLLEDQLETYQKQKEEISSLQKYLKEQAFSQKKPSPCKDGNKMAYDRRGERNHNSKRRATTQAKAKLEEKLKNKLDNPLPKNFTGISFQSKLLEGKVAISLDNISVRVHNKLLIEGLSTELHPGDRIILSGPNGSGKSTLLKVLAYKLEHYSGTIDYSPQVVLGHLDQEPVFEDQTKTLIDYLHTKFSIPESRLISYLYQTGLIEGRFLGQQVGSLSLGQKRRLQILELILSESNVLLLDEPTNHLAPHVIDQLEEALLSFKGAVIAATHDRRFAERIGTSYLEW